MPLKSHSELVLYVNSDKNTHISSEIKGFATISAKSSKISLNYKFSSVGLEELKSSTKVYIEMIAAYSGRILTQNPLETEL